MKNALILTALTLSATSALAQTSTMSMPMKSTMSMPGSATMSMPGSRTMSMPGSRTMSMPGSRTMSMPGSRTMSMPGSRTMSMPAGGMTMRMAPNFRYSTMKGMNMMMTAGTLDVGPVPGERLISRSVSGRQAILIYMGSNSLAVFSYYDSAIKAEGWKTTMMDGMMMNGAATRPGSMNQKMGGIHSATFEMGGHTIKLLARASGGRVTTTLISQ